MVVSSGASLSWAVIDSGCRIEAGATVGDRSLERLEQDQIVLMGRDSTVGAGSTVAPGARLEPGSSG